jgi:hypothetical protein
MKFLKLTLTILIVFSLLLTGCNPSYDVKTEPNSVSYFISKIDQMSGQSTKLTLEIVKKLSEKGDDLSWRHFEAYDCTDIGSGLYILLYPIDDKYELPIGGGSLERIPMHIYLTNKNTNKSIDIRYEDIDEFVK